MEIKLPRGKILDLYFHESLIQFAKLEQIQRIYQSIEICR